VYLVKFLENILQDNMQLLNKKSRALLQELFYSDIKKCKIMVDKLCLPVYIARNFRVLLKRPGIRTLAFFLISF